MPVPTIIEELWGENPPRSARTTLQINVMQLRQLIVSALEVGARLSADDVLHTRFGGYRLDVADECVDACGFECLAAAGERAFDSSDMRTATQVLRNSLEIWGGAALVDVSTGPIAGYGDDASGRAPAGRARGAD